MSIPRITQILEKSVKLITANATGAAAINASLAAGKALFLREIRIHLSGAGGAGDLTVTIDAGAGAAYDTVLATQDMTLVTDYFWQPTVPIYLTASDVLKIAWANASNRTYGLTLVYEEVVQ